MTDETTLDKPLATLAGAERAINPPVVAQADPIPAVDRLLAFEHEKLGPDAPRFAGKLERGSGSLFGRMSDANKAHHTALERLVDTEAKLAAAHTTLLAAESEHEAALAAVAKSEG